MAMGFNSWAEAGLAAGKQGILEEHDFRPYSPYGEKELMMMKFILGSRALTPETLPKIIVSTPSLVFRLRNGRWRNLLSLNILSKSRYNVV